MQKDKEYSPEFKAKIVSDYSDNNLSLQELSFKYDVSCAEISKWVNTVKKNITSIFSEEVSSSSMVVKLLLKRLEKEGIPQIQAIRDRKL
jgi:transposase-like protein